MELLLNCSYNVMAARKLLPTLTESPSKVPDDDMMDDDDIESFAALAMPKLPRLMNRVHESEGCHGGSLPPK